MVMTTKYGEVQHRVSMSEDSPFILDIRIKNTEKIIATLYDKDTDNLQIQFDNWLRRANREG